MTHKDGQRNFIKQAAKSLGVALALNLLAASAANAAELTVQIGAFGVQPNADFVKQAGEYGEVLVLRGLDNVTRVSIGRYDSTAAAEAALARLHVAGYNDAYIANVSGYPKAAPAVAEAPAFNAAPATTTTRSSNTPRTITNPATASTQRLPSGGQIVPPKQPPVTDGVDSTTQAGRFRLRTHDTQSGKTSDVQLESGLASELANTGQTAVVAGPGANNVPPHLRDKLVYLDGVPHIKDGDQFIPLTDVPNGK